MLKPYYICGIMGLGMYVDGAEITFRKKVISANILALQYSLYE